MGYVLIRITPSGSQKVHGLPTFSLSQTPEALSLSLSIQSEEGDMKQLGNGERDWARGREGGRAREVWGHLSPDVNRRSVNTDRLDRCTVFKIRVGQGANGESGRRGVGR